jgi:hypothetical protein
LHIAIARYDIRAEFHDHEDGGGLVASGTILFSLPGAPDEDLRRLAGWLRDEDELRGRVRAADGPSRPGEMGGALEAVSVAITSATLPVFFRSLFDWLARSREARRVSFTLTLGKKTLELECGSEDSFEKVLTQARDFLDQES